MITEQGGNLWFRPHPGGGQCLQSRFLWFVSTSQTVLRVYPGSGPCRLSSIRVVQRELGDVMAKSYEVLMGAVGRSVFFRPERQRVREPLSRDARPQLLVDGVHFPLFDISMNGVSFLADADSEMWRVGEEIGLTLVLHDEVVYQGRARVARAETGFGRSVRIGLGLTTGFLDLLNSGVATTRSSWKRTCLKARRSASDWSPSGTRWRWQESHIFSSSIKNRWIITSRDIGWIALATRALRH